MDEVALPDGIEPTHWNVIFHRRGMGRVLSVLAAGEFKHVSALGYFPGFKQWLLFDPQWSGIRLQMFSQEGAKAALAKYFAAGCEVVLMERGPEPMALASRLGLYCVPAVKHLLAVRCPLWRPDALYRHLLRNGGKRVDGQRQPSATSDRS